MAHLFKRLWLKEIAKVPVRYKNGPNHWSTIRKKTAPKGRALQHFDEFYTVVYGDAWLNIREALLLGENKYVAVVNNFSDTERIRSDLESKGAINLKAIYDTFKQHFEESSQFREQKKQRAPSSIDRQMRSVLANTELSEVQSVYSTDFENVPQKLHSGDDETGNKDKGLDPVELKSIEPDLNKVVSDASRVIDPSVNLSSLYEYVPATKLKGMDDWILESDYYKHYADGADFSPRVEKEPILSFPEHLHVYTFEAGNETRFPAPKLGSTGVSDYYLFDGGSILPILAMDIQAGDVVLDMCAAPGGKALTIFQTLMPKIIVANDIMQSRTNMINNIMKKYVIDIDEENRSFFVTSSDARWIEDKDTYNKILVDVPCTVDRDVLQSDDNNHFKPSSIKQRLKIPELQTEILTNALKLVSVGGTVVYSTCSLSPVQNDGVVQMALKNIFQETDSVMVVKDLTRALKPLSCLYEFGNIELKYGHIIVPTIENNWGPIYFCKIVRVR